MIRDASDVLYEEGETSGRVMCIAIHPTSPASRIGSAISTVRRFTGRQPQGWIGQEFGESTRTPAIVAQQGLAYIADWPNDEQPYPMLGGRLLSLPQQANWDDVQLLWLRQISSGRYPAMIESACDTLLEDGTSQGRMLGLGIHPWLSGQAHRIKYMKAALAGVMARQCVWHTDGRSIAAHYLQEHPRSQA